MTTLDELLAEAALWDGARNAHLDQARSSMTKIAELELQIEEALEIGRRAARSAERTFASVLADLALRSAPSTSRDGGLP